MWRALFIVGCFFNKPTEEAVVTSAPNVDLSGIHRTLIKWEGYEPRTRGLTIEFTEDGLEFDCGCNSNHGSYTIREERLFVKEVRSTEMACLPPPFEGLGSPNDDEYWMRNFLFKGPKVSYKNDILILSHEDVILTFGDASKLPPAPDFIAFYDTKWLIEEVLDEDIPIIRMIDDSPSVIFSFMDQFTLDTGCNTGTTRFTELSASITINPHDFTQLKCSPKNMAKMDGFLQRFFQSPELQVDKNGANLILRNKNFGVRLLAKSSSE